MNGYVGNQFRRWASEVLMEYLKKGFAMNDERLKNPKNRQKPRPDVYLMFIMSKVH